MRAVSYILILAVVSSSAYAMGQVTPLQRSVRAECSEYRFSNGDATLSSFNPAPQIIRQVPLPGNTQTLFRGAYEDNKQFDAEKIIQGLLGETGWVLGSPMFRGITQVLTGTRDLNEPFLPKGQMNLKMRRYFEARDILQEIEMLLQCRSPRFYSNLEAAELAKDLVTKSFERQSRDEIEKNYLNIKDPKYYSSYKQELGFGNNAADFVTATYNDQIASIYGRKVMVMKDRKGRGVDLGYWNFQKNKIFWDDWVDNGEIDIPGYIQSADLIGYQDRAIDRVKKGWGTTYPHNPINYALYRGSYQGQPVVLVVDGKQETCLVHDETLGKVFFCKESGSVRVTKDITPPPEPRGTGWQSQAPLIGVLMLCPSGTACPVPQKIFQDYKNVRETSANPTLLQAFEKITVNGKPVKFLRPADSELPRLPVLKVLSATYAEPSELGKASGNVTKEVAAYIDTKTSLKYRVSTRFLKTPADKKDKEFVIEYFCADNPAKKIKASIPAPAEGKSLSLSCGND